MVKLIKLYPDNPDISTIKSISKMILKGAICVLPTDTIYGLHCRADLEASVKKLQLIKGRVEPKPLVTLIPGVDFLLREGFEIPDKALKLMKKFWPGPLTIVLKAPSNVSSQLTGGTGTLAVRQPGFPILEKIVVFSGVPIVSTSANKIGDAPFEDPRKIASSFGNEIDLIVDGGKLPRKLPSTLISFTSDSPEILRDGAIPRSVLKPFLQG